MVKPAARRRVVQFWINAGLLSERHGCRLMEVSRSTVRYKSNGRDDASLRTRLTALAEKYPRYGYPTLHTMFRTEGLVENHKRTYRIYSEEGLQVRTKKRKKLTRPRIPMVLPTKANERWSIDFVDLTPGFFQVRSPVVPIHERKGWVPRESPDPPVSYRDNDPTAD